MKTMCKLAVCLVAFVAVSAAFADDYLETMRQRELRMMSHHRYAKVQRAELRDWALGQRELTAAEVHALRAGRQEAARQSRQLRKVSSPDVLVSWRWADIGEEAWPVAGRSIRLHSLNLLTSETLSVGPETLSEMLEQWLVGGAAPSAMYPGGAAGAGPVSPAMFGGWPTGAGRVSPGAATRGRGPMSGPMMGPPMMPRGRM